MLLCQTVSDSFAVLELANAKGFGRIYTVLLVYFPNLIRQVFRLVHYGGFGNVQSFLFVSVQSLGPSWTSGQYYFGNHLWRALITTGQMEQCVYSYLQYIQWAILLLFWWGKLKQL